MRIAIDIDDVLTDFLSEFLHWRNRRFGTRWQRQDFWSYDWVRVFAEDRQTLNAVLFDFFNSREIRKIAPMPGAKRGIKKLKKRGHHMSIVTSRPRLIAELTGDWLQRHFHDAFEMIYFSDNPEWNSPGLSKGQIADAWQADVLIDDQIRFCREAADHGVPALLFDNPWNRQEALVENIYRVITWGDIVRISREFEN